MSKQSKQRLVKSIPNFDTSTGVTPILQDKAYWFPKKKNFRERYKRISQSKWFKNTYNGKTLGEIMTVEE